VEINGEPWFNAHDVCQVLGLANTANAIRPLHEADVSVYRMDTKGRPSRILNEAGLYKLIMRSDKAEARPFQDWVTRVVLPAIRKDGGSETTNRRTPHDNHRTL
jgi:prophage antirepressor-like protein